MSLRLGWWASSVLAVTLATGVASAQSLDEEQEAAGDGADRLGAPGRLGDEQADVEDGSPREAPHDSTDPRELENTDYFFLGGFYRHVFIPSFIQRVGPIHGGIDADNPGAGLSFTYRRNNFSVVANVWWNGAQGEGFFRASGDPRTDTEHVIADMGVVFLNAEFLWAFPITDWFAIELGFDLGVGFVYGTVIRTEAYESNVGADDWQPCIGPNNPATAGPGYCEDFGGHYRTTEPNWTGGGDVPVIVPWLSVPHIALRFKPIRQIQIRVDGGWGIYNFFVGGSVAYGF